MCPGLSLTPERAYPRSRGETSDKVTREYDDKGLSPLARGNLMSGFCAGAIVGPIPARAGKPST